MAVFLSDVRQALAVMLGEETIASSWPHSRDLAIQWSLERISRMYDFDFGLKSVNITTDGSGEYAFTTNDGLRFDPRLDVRVVNPGTADDFVFRPVNRSEFDNFAKGDYRFYIDTAADGTQTLVTTEPSTVLQVTGTRIAPTISETVPSNFPSALAIAKGALIYVREFEDKDADISVDDAKFRQIVDEVTGQEQRNQGPQRAITRQEITGHYTGEVRTDIYAGWGF